MTLKSLFSKTFWARFFKRFTQYNWLTALWSVCLFFAFPVAGALILSSNLTSENYWTVARVSNVILGQVGFVCGATILLAILTPNAFNYLNSRKQLDFYHSQPVTRKELFWRNYFVGWLSFLIPLTAGFLCEAGIIMLLPGIGWENVFILFKGFFACVGMYFSVNALCLLAVMLCGNRFISLLTGVYFCGAPAMIFGMFRYFVESFSSTFAYEDVMNEILSGISPLVFLLDFIGFKDDGYAVFTSSFWWTVAWMFVSVCAVFLARGLYLRRKSESAGKPLSFPKSILFIKYPLTVFCAWVGGMLFDAMGDNVVWMLFGFITFAVITWCIVSGLEKFEFRNAFRGMWKLLICGGVFLSCLLLVFVGCVLFDKRVTKDENIISIDVQNFYYNESVNGGDNYRMHYDYKEIEGEEAIKALNVIMKQGAKQTFTGSGSINVNDVIVSPYVESDRANVSIEVRVHTKFGSYTRYYSYICEPQSEILQAVKDFAYSAGAKKAQAEFSLESVDTTVDRFSFRPSLLTAAKMEEVYNALKKDMAAATVKDYEADPIGAVEIRYSGRFYEWMSNSEVASVLVPVYPAYKETLKLIDAESISDVVVSDYVGTFDKTYYDYTDDEYDLGYKEGYSEGVKKGQACGDEGLAYEIPDLSDYQYSSSTYDQGYYQGFREGYDQGYNVSGDAYTEGYNKGYEDGIEAGKADAENGYDYTTPEYVYDGLSYTDGYQQGYAEGYSEGYNKHAN